MKGIAPPRAGLDPHPHTRCIVFSATFDSAAAGKVAESFERLDKMGAIVACDFGDQADKLGDEYLRQTKKLLRKARGFNLPYDRRWWCH